FIKDELMFCVDTYEAEGHIIPQTTMEFNGVEMKAGDSIWLVSDTKANGGWDSPWYYLVIRLVSK
ncbi:MAG: hypothetical protein CW338_08705, partial [Clostridiales bacterium]|nr:hypothetical protein [Clostridiales bacterium]